MSEGRVSVVIPLYNHERYIAQAIESVLAQGALLSELIVIDDGSQDGSADVMAELAAGDKRIVFLRQRNGGAHEAINRGLSMARGEFVTVLNSDDAYSPGRFEALIRALDLDPGSDVAASAIDFMDDHGRTIDNPWFEAALANFKVTRDFACAMINANFLMTTSNYFMRRRVVDKVGFFAPLRYTHDLEYALRWAAQGVRLCYIDRPLMRYRFHASNTISENHLKVRAEWALCASVYLRLQYGGSHSDGESRYQAIRQVLERHGLAQAVDLALKQLTDRGINVVSDVLMGDKSFMESMLKVV